MSGATTLPDSVRVWAESVVGPLTSLDDAPSAARSSPSRVWEVTAGRQGGGDRFWVKLAASPLAFTRETFAHRHAVSYLGPGRAPRLTATSAQHLALITTTVSGTPLSALTATGAALEAVHRKAGALVAQLHQAGKPTRAAREEAGRALRHTADRAERSVRVAGEQLPPAEREFMLAHTAGLRDAGRVPLGYIHGGLDEHALRWSGVREPLALVDFQRARFAPVVLDFVPLACGPWVGQPRLRTAFFTGYGRRLLPEEKRALYCLTALRGVGRTARQPMPARHFPHHAEGAL